MRYLSLWSNLKVLTLHFQCYPQAEFAVTLGGVNTPYTVTVTVDGRQFTGEGRNKKDAKKMCAIAAAKGLLNIDY